MAQTRPPEEDQESDDYVTVRLPRELGNAIDRFRQSSGLGFRSRAEVVTAATREYLLRYESRPETGPPLVSAEEARRDAPKRAR